MNSFRSTSLLLTAAIALGSAAPAFAYHDAYHSSPYTTTRYSNYNYLGEQVIEDIYTVYHEEHRAYTRYDETHKKHPYYKVFSSAVARKADNLKKLRDLLSKYGVSAPRTGHVYTYQGYSEQDTCREAHENEERVARIYSTLINKVRNHNDIRIVFEGAKRDADHLEDEFHKCATYGSTSHSYNHYQPVHQKTVYRNYSYPRTTYSNYRAYTAPRYYNRYSTQYPRYNTYQTPYKRYSNYRRYSSNRYNRYHSGYYSRY